MSYIRRRDNGVYYYERRVPRAVIERVEEFNRYFDGVQLFRRTLRSKRQVEAMAAGIERHEDFERRVKLALGRSVPSDEHADNATRPLTPDLLHKIRSRAQESVVLPWVKQILHAQRGGGAVEELDRMRHQRELDAEQIRAVLDPVTGARASSELAPRNPKLPDFSERATRLIEEERIYAPLGGNAWAAVATAMREGILAGEREVDQLLAGETSAIPDWRLKRKRAGAPKISMAVAEYIDQLRAQRTIREAQEALRAFIGAIGDLPLDEISRSDFIAFCKSEGNRTIGGKSADSIVRPVAPGTLKKKVGLLRSAINHAIETERFEGPNPAAKINAKQFTKPVPRALMPAKRPFDVHELKLILQHPWFTGCRSPSNVHEAGDHRLVGVHYWAPILAMLSGCRAGELGGLRISEVRLDHRHPHIVIQDNRYRPTKGSYRRKVPVLDVLMDHGFPSFVDRVGGAGHDRLFPDWTPPRGNVDASANAWSNGSVIRAFNRTVVPQQLRSILEPGARQEVTFHSFRGAFKTLLGRSEYALPPNYIHEVIGHAKSGLDQRYVGEIPLEETYEAIRKCHYSGLKLPPAP